MNNNITQDNNNIELQYAKYKSIDISKRIFSWWDVFLFILLFACSFCFMVGFTMFLIGGIGFYTEVDVVGNPEKIGNNNGYWHIMNIYNGNWTDFADQYAYIDNIEFPSDYQKFIKNAFLLKDIYNAGFLLWLIPLIIFCCFSLIVIIIYVFWVNGYIDSIGKYIFTKIKNINDKIDNYKPLDQRTKDDKTTTISNQQDS